MLQDHYCTCVFKLERSVFRDQPRQQLAYFDLQVRPLLYEDEVIETLKKAPTRIHTSSNGTKCILPDRIARCGEFQPLVAVRTPHFILDEGQLPYHCSQWDLLPPLCAPSWLGSFEAYPGSTTLRRTSCSSCDSALHVHALGLPYGVT